MIKFILLVNKQGQTRLSSYYTWMTIPERVALEAEIIRKCLSRSELQCSFTEHRGYKVSGDTINGVCRSVCVRVCVRDELVYCVGCVSPQ